MKKQLLHLLKWRREQLWPNLSWRPPCSISLAKLNCNHLHDLHSQSLRYCETIKSPRQISLLRGQVCFLVHLDLDGMIETRANPLMWKSQLTESPPLKDKVQAANKTGMALTYRMSRIEDSTKIFSLSFP